MSLNLCFLGDLQTQKFRFSRTLLWKLSCFNWPHMCDKFVLQPCRNSTSRLVISRLSRMFGKYASETVAVLGFGLLGGGSNSLIRYLVEQLGLNLSHKENRVFARPKLLKRLYRFSNDIPVHSISTGCSTLTQSRWAPSCHTWRGTNLTWQKWVGISTLLIKIGGSRKKHF